MAEPLPLCHLDGALLPLRAARISPLDRGFLFGDGVYEVIAVRHGCALRLEHNLARLARSLHELRIRDPHTPQEWRRLVYALVAAITPTVFGFCAPLPLPDPATLANGIRCISAADTRWARCDIKSVALLANVLLRQQAIDAGASETLLLRDGQLTEASASAVHVVIGGEIRTPPRTTRLLPATTRGFIEELAAANGIACRSAPVSESELRSAEEIWVSAATRGAVPVTTLDGRPVGDGRPGPLWQRMHALIEAAWTQARR